MASAFSAGKGIRKGGATGPVKVDIRILVASHPDLNEMIIDNAFRKDPYFRLSVFPIVNPTLIARKRDLASRVQYFIIGKYRQM